LYHFWRWCRCSIVEPNHEGLGLQDEYLRSDGVGRDFLKIDAGGSLHPTSLKRWKRTDIILFKTENCFKYAVTT
jgi:3-oxoacyl-[acyl-carrier-protein] synthase-3